MLGREPRLPHKTMRWMIIALMLINGIQLVLLQATINSAVGGGPGQTWPYVILSGVGLLISALVLGYAFMRGRSRAGEGEIKVRPPQGGGRGTVSSNDLDSENRDKGR